MEFGAWNLGFNLLHSLEEDFMAEELKILVVTGASGGHIFPAGAFLESLRRECDNIDALLVLPRRSNLGDFNLESFDREYISVSNFGAPLSLKSLFAFWDFLKSIIESLFIFLRFHPNIVVGFGTSVSVPVVFWAWLFRIKILIHEQNVIPGRANRFLSKFSDLIAVSFAETAEYLANSRDKIVITGNPIRRGLRRYKREEALSFFTLKRDKFTILVFGGSCGSHRVNTIFLESITGIPKKDEIQVIHLAGKNDCEFVINEYRKSNIDSRVFVFLKEMHYAYSVADLVVCRAGATTLAEIISYRIPAVLMPYPFAYRHQMANAKSLENRGAAVVFDEASMNSSILKKELEGLINNRLRLDSMISSYRDFGDSEEAPADSRLVKEAILLAGD